MDMERGGPKPTVKNHRRVLTVAAVITCITVVAVLYRHSTMSHLNLYHHAETGAVQILGHFRFKRFPWYVSSVDMENDIALPSDSALSDVHLKGTKKLPQAIIIGAKKAGTRALLEFIRVHPNVRAAGHEVHYFDKNYSKGKDWYRNMMPMTIDHQITLEKTPSYLVTPEAPQRVHDLNPNMRIIIVVKDPVERAISDYTQSSTKHHRRRSFEEFVFLDLNGMEVNKTRLSITTGIYSRHLKNWLKYFPLQQFCFINGETLISDPAAELKRLQEFLGLKQVITDEHFYFNSTKGFPCLKKREASGTPHCLGDGKGRTHPTVPVQAKVALYDYFRPHNTEFYKMTGIDFNWEKRGPFERLTDK